MLFFFRPAFTALLIISLLATSSCSVFSIYRTPSQQGTAISQAQLDNLTTKMTKDDVARLLGSPLINDPLAADVWIYPFIKKEKGKVVHQQVVRVLFTGDNFSSVEIDGELAH